MVNGSAKKLEIRTDKGCATCKEAIANLVPIAIENNIPVQMLPVLDSDKFIPIVCFVDEGDVVITRTCIKGYSKGVNELFKEFIDE